MSSTRTSCSRSRSAARKSGASWKIWRAAVMMPAGSKASGMRRSRTSRYSEYSAAAAIQSGRSHCRAKATRSSAVRPDSMIRSKSWRTSCRKPRVCRAAPRSSGQGSSRPGSAWPSSSSLMIRSCSGPERSLRRPRQRQDAFRLGPPDQVEGIGRPGPGRRGAQAPVQPGREAVPERVRGEPPGRQDEHPLRVQAVPHRPGGRRPRPGPWTCRCRARRAPGRVRSRAGRRRRRAGPATAPGPRCAACRGGSSRRPVPPELSCAPDGGRDLSLRRLVSAWRAVETRESAGVLTQSFHHRAPTIYAAAAPAARRSHRSGRNRRRSAPTGPPCRSTRQRPSPVRR